ncbi:acyltransferase family protein [Clostridium vincentii]|uniref:Glucans biosynthesis protein C n=1 Tax=Clostridium vincentii TaxID=52704 RepID=A0A2T0BI67_9CLOT|nr:acyltransferase family protein [Clostridium vincentii]PRR83578.1 Glucans biosynthesis protein C [Clostridium vincentii]
MRKYYIDNIRIFCILLLFPFHTCMIFNTFGEPFYVFSEPVNIFSQFVNIVYPWWMALLFAIAGISSAYALKKRSGKKYSKERVSKLLIPLMFGLVTIIPLQTYIADVFHNGYAGGYFEHYKVFFTKFTDLTGYDGGFTTAHTWFMLYLFVISMISLPIMLWYNKSDKKFNGSKITMPILLPMFIIILLMTPIVEVGGKSVGEFLACFLIGFFILSLDDVQDKLMKYRIPLSILWIVFMALRSYLYFNNGGHGLVWDIEQRMLTWIGILAIMGFGKRYLNFNNKFTQYFSPAAFPIYLFHQTVLVVIAFYVLKVTNIIPLQFGLIVVMTFVITLLCYEISRRFSVTCFMFGVKKKKDV